jgi:nucleoside-diphosphate-sugar epimerase
VSKVVLAGASGFVGSHVTKHLLELGYEVAALVRIQSAWLGPSIKKSPKLTLYRLSRDCCIPLEALDGAVAVINAVTAYGRDGDVNAVEVANVRWPAQLLHAADAVGCPRFIQFDSFFAKPGLLHDYLPIYTDSKRRGQQSLIEAGRDLQIELINARLEHVYGAGDDGSKFVPWLLRSLLMHKSPLKMTSGFQQRDFIHVDDVAAAVSVLVEASPRTADYQIGNALPVSVRQLCIMAHRVCQSRSEFDFGALPAIKGEINISVANIGPLRALGWQPRITLEVGLEMTVVAMLTQLHNLKRGVSI